MEKCPPELLHKIFKFLDLKEIKVIRQICQVWNEVVENVTGLDVRLDDAQEWNRSFVESVKLNHLTVQDMSSLPFCPKCPHALLRLTCLRPARLWFVEEVLLLQNLNSLRLFGEFFYLQDLPQYFPPSAFSNSYLPNLRTLSVEIPGTYQLQVRPPMACGVYPKLEEKLCERSTKNIWWILQVIRSPKLEVLEILDDFPRCGTSGTNTVRRYQWWGQVFAGFMSYHQYSLKDLRFKKVFIPYPEDPYSTENPGIPRGLRELCLSILGADLGNFQYWRGIIEAQENLERLELHLSGAFWKRYDITPLIKSSRKWLTELDLSLEFDSDTLSLGPGPGDGKRFDFGEIAACSQLGLLKIGPCGYLAPTSNFCLIPRLLTNLTGLYLTFLEISREELESIREFENLKTLCLQSLIQMTDGCIYSSVDLPLLKTFLEMRTLDCIAVDLVAVGESKSPIVDMSMKLFGRGFQGSGFYIPFELEDQMTISSSNLRIPPNNEGVHADEESAEEFGLFRENISDGGGNILPNAEDGDEVLLRHGNVYANDVHDEHDNVDDPDVDVASDTNYNVVPFRCPCETKARVLRRPGRCVSRFCIPTMVDICEDLMRADKLPLWDLYMDGVISYSSIREFLPDPLPGPVNEEECCCLRMPRTDSDKYRDFNRQTADIDIRSKTDDNEARNQQNSELVLEKNRKACVKDDCGKLSEQIQQASFIYKATDSNFSFSDKIQDQLHVRDSDPAVGSYQQETRATMAAAAVYEAMPYAENLPSTNSKDWFTQTDITKQDSTDVMTQYENQRFFCEDIDKLEVQSCDSESQTDLRCSLPNCPSVDMATQKGLIIADSSTQHEINVKDSSTQNHSIAAEESVMDAVLSVDVSVQNELLVVFANKETQKEVKAVDAEVQNGNGVLGSFEDQETRTDFEIENAASKNYADVFIQAFVNESGASKSCQCLCGNGQHETFEQAVQTREANSKQSIGIQAVQDSVDVMVQKHQISSSMRAQTVDSNNNVVFSKSVQTVFSPYCRQPLDDDGAQSEKMEAFTQTEKDQDGQVNHSVSQDSKEDKMSLKLEEKMVKVSAYTDSSTQYDFLQEMADACTSPIPTEDSVLQAMDALTSYENLLKIQDSTTQYEFDCTDSKSLTQPEENQRDPGTIEKRAVVTDSATQYEHERSSSNLESSDKITQFENIAVEYGQSLDVMTQYDLIDLSCTPEECESTGDDTPPFGESLSECVSATAIRGNLVKEEMNNSKVSYLRDRVEDCLLNWTTHQYDRESHDEEQDLDTEGEYDVEESEPPNFIDQKLPLDDLENAKFSPDAVIDKLSSGDTTVATVRGGKRSRKISGSRKFCIVM